MGDQLRSTATLLLLVAGAFGLVALVGAFLLAAELGGARSCSSRSLPPRYPWCPTSE